MNEQAADTLHKSGEEFQSDICLDVTSVDCKH